jgi:hypothetical protein
LLLVTVASVAAVAEECRVMVQLAPGAVLHLIAAQHVQEILLLQAILLAVQPVPILAVAAVELVKVNINHIQEQVVLVDLVLQFFGIPMYMQVPR